MFLSIAYASEAYRVEINGIEDKELLALIRSSSQLVSLSEAASPTASVLRKRADSDIPRLLRVLHNSAYYNAKIHFMFDFSVDPILVIINIDLGPVYPIAAFYVEGVDMKLKTLDIKIGEPALPEKILHAEECLLFHLAKKGYPYAKIIRRDALADQQTKTVSVTLHVDPGQPMCFGQTAITGNCSVKKAFFKKKIAWCTGSRFDPLKLLETQNALEESRLFRIVNITYPDHVADGCQIPMKIDVVEAKHRSVGAGVSISTQLGPGVEVEWENRNMRGMGETLRVEANILGRLQEGVLQYIMPDLLFRHQDLVFRADYTHEVTKGYKETAYSFSSLIQHRINPCTTLSYGAMVTELKNSGSDDNGSFHLIKTPLTLRWHKTDNLLDPTRGGSFFGRIVPTAQIMSHKFIYSINQITGTCYLSVHKNPRIVLAVKGILGSIIGTTRREIPPSERFYAGSETTLRGYRYMTVSPLHHDKPIGGRSMMIGTLEMRWRITERMGMAYFYDVGNVYSEPYPQFNKRLFNSLGVGARYYTSVGPIRLDVAFPQNPRKGIDPKFQLYFSIGQAF